MHIVLIPSWWPTPEQPLSGTFTVDYARAFVAAGHKVGVLFPDLVSLRRMRWNSRPPLSARLTEKSIERITVVRVRGVSSSLGRPRAHMRRYLRWLKRAWEHYVGRHCEPDVIAAHCAIPAGWAAAQLEGEGQKRVVITEHTGPFALALKPKSAERLTRAALADAARVVAVSEPLRVQMAAAGIEREIEVIANPVMSVFAWSPPETAREAYRLAFVGRLVREKGVEELMEAFARAAESLDSLQLDVVGDGPCRAAMERKGGALMKDGRVRFHGFCEKPAIAALLRKSHGLVHPSHGENCPLAIAEALCVGRPVLTTEGTGCEAMLEAGDGIVCAPRNVEALERGMLEMAARNDKFDHAAIARRGVSRFGSAAVAARYTALFESVVKR